MSRWNLSSLSVGIQTSSGLRKKNKCPKLFGKRPHRCCTCNCTWATSALIWIWSRLSNPQVPLSVEDHIGPKVNHLAKIVSFHQMTYRSVQPFCTAQACAQHRDTLAPSHAHITHVRAMRPNNQITRKVRVWQWRSWCWPNSNSQPKWSFWIRFHKM